MSGLEELSREELIALVLQLRETNVVLEERVRRLERQSLAQQRQLFGAALQ